MDEASPHEGERADASRPSWASCISEVDALYAPRDAQHQHEAHVVAQLLTLMDGASSHEGKRSAASRHSWASQLLILLGGISVS